MKGEDLLGLTASGMHELIKSGEASSEEVCRAFVERIEEVDTDVRAFLYFEPEEVLQQARSIDQRILKGSQKMGVFTGIPVAIKDVIVTRNVRTTCGSRLLRDYRPPYDATVAQRLRQHGAVLLGKTNCDEFAMGSSTENSAFGPTRNPWDRERVPGGSSGGSAACVAAREAPLALGTDTGGSIRQPAAFCGVVGLKPTYGRISRYGLVAFASSLDQIGPITRSVRDSAGLLSVIAGEDPRDSTSSPNPVENYVEELDKDCRSLRIGVAADWIAALSDPEIKGALENSVRALDRGGFSISEVQLPHDYLSIAAYYLVATAEASSNLARYDGIRYGHRSDSTTNVESLYRKTRNEGFGEEVKRRIMLGTFALSSGYYDAYYRKASQVRRLVRDDFMGAFQGVDIILGPVTPTPPFKLGEKLEDPLEMYLSDVFTVSANLAGLPGLSLPAGFTRSGLPIGVQLLARPFAETSLFQVAHFLEGELAVQAPPLPI